MRTRRNRYGSACVAIGLLAGGPPAATIAQEGTLSGRVVETGTERPVAGATVRIEDTAWRVLTDEDGAFRFRGLDVGAVVLLVERAGYEAVRRELSLRAGADRRIVIGLEASPETVAYRLDPITVTATRGPARVSGVPANVSVVEAERLEVTVARSVDDLLSGLPNVTTVGGPRGQAELPQIRGLGADRIIFRVDGARQDFASGHKGRLFLDPALLARVEVVRGPGSVLYGSGALGGVVSFETKDAADLLRAGETVGMRLAPRYLSGSREWGGSGSVYGSPGPVDFVAAASVRNADDVELSTGGRLPFSGYETWGALGKLGWAPAAGQRLELSYDRFDETSTTPLDATGTDTLPDQVADRRSLRSTLRAGYELEDPASAWLDLQTGVYRTESSLGETRQSDERFETRELVTWGVDVANTTRYALSDAMRGGFTYGVEWFRDASRGRRDGEPLGSFPDGDATFTGLFVQNDWVIAERLRLVPGLRWERYESVSDDPANDPNEDDELALELAAQIGVTNFLDVYGGVSEGFNAPRLLDLYTSGLHFPAPPGAPFPNNFFVPSPHLAPERTETLEAGLRLRFDDVLGDDDGVRVEIAYFETDAEDFIARDVDVAGGTSTFRNLDRVDIEGLETAVRYESSALSGGLSHGRVRMWNLPAAAPVDDAPADTWILDLGVRMAGTGLAVGYQGVFAEAQERVSAPERATPGYGVSDLYARWTPATGFLDGFEVTLRADNVLDKAYRRHGSFIPATGRSLRLEVARAVKLR